MDSTWIHLVMNSHVRIHIYEFICSLNSSNTNIFPPLSIKVISMSMTLFPSMATLALPWMNKQKVDPEKLHLQLTQMWGGEKGSEVNSEDLNTIHAKSCLHRGMWNGQQYDRSLHTLMRSVIPSCNNVIKLPLMWTRSIVEGSSILTPNLVGHVLLQNLLSWSLVILTLLPIGTL